ncbi:DUF4249 domain-containing protein [Olleya aquimaris]|uniref:Uncharacterized protein DUF4249 n=1 Tax=Olleya aquimaris TaxID=639310 RepID=A0A327R512_9FLAO|nr:DUF4249 domain-containing protein [Olleya aquimaris]RAJ11909.1 uncharacterized protein DUF4249 [Olleya aquimaris]
MKNIRHNIINKSLYLLLILIVFNCEDVIDLKVPTSDPKLVIEASLNWFDGTDGSNQEIKLTLSAPFFDSEVPPANNAIVTVEDTNGNTFNFSEDGNSGIYKTTNFIPVVDQEYTLSINYNGETYIGTEILKSVTPIDYIEQNNEGGFSGEDIELKAYYTDPENIENYYFYEFISDIPEYLVLEVYDDEFTDGNQIFAFYTEEDLEAGDQVIINNYGVSKQFYQFMFLLLQQTAEDGGGPFETQPATVRGNCVNITNPDNFPLGYFRVSQAYQFTYIVE